MQEAEEEYQCSEEVISDSEFSDSSNEVHSINAKHFDSNRKSPEIPLMWNFEGKCDQKRMDSFLPNQILPNHETTIMERVNSYGFGKLNTSQNVLDDSNYEKLETNSSVINNFNLNSADLIDGKIVERIIDNLNDDIPNSDKNSAIDFTSLKYINSKENNNFGQSNYLNTSLQFLSKSRDVFLKRNQKEKVNAFNVLSENNQAGTVSDAPTVIFHQKDSSGKLINDGSRKILSLKNLERNIGNMTVNENRDEHQDEDILNEEFVKEHSQLPSHNSVSISEDLHNCSQSLFINSQSQVIGSGSIGNSYNNTSNQNCFKFQHSQLDDNTIEEYDCSQSLFPSPPNNLCLPKDVINSKANPIFNGCKNVIEIDTMNSDAKVICVHETENIHNEKRIDETTPKTSSKQDQEVIFKNPLSILEPGIIQQEETFHDKHSETCVSENAYVYENRELINCLSKSNVLEPNDRVKTSPLLKSLSDSDPEKIVNMQFEATEEIICTHIDESVDNDEPSNQCSPSLLDLIHKYADKSLDASNIENTKEQVNENNERNIDKFEYIKTLRQDRTFNSVTSRVKSETSKCNEITNAGLKECIVSASIMNNRDQPCLKSLEMQAYSHVNETEDEKKELLFFKTKSTRCVTRFQTPWKSNDSDEDKITIKNHTGKKNIEQVTTITTVQYKNIENFLNETNSNHTLNSETVDLLTVKTSENAIEKENINIFKKIADQNYIIEKTENRLLETIKGKTTESLDQIRTHIGNGFNTNLCEKNGFLGDISEEHNKSVHHKNFASTMVSTDIMGGNILEETQVSEKPTYETTTTCNKNSNDYLKDKSEQVPLNEKGLIFSDSDQYSVTDQIGSDKEKTRNMFLRRSKRKKQITRATDFRNDFGGKTKRFKLSNYSKNHDNENGKSSVEIIECIHGNNSRSHSKQIGKGHHISPTTVVRQNSQKIIEKDDTCAKDKYLLEKIESRLIKIGEVIRDKRFSRKYVNRASTLLKKVSFVLNKTEECYKNVATEKNFCKDFDSVISPRIKYLKNLYENLKAEIEVLLMQENKNESSKEIFTQDTNNEVKRDALHQFKNYRENRDAMHSSDKTHNLKDPNKEVQLILREQGNDVTKNSPLQAMNKKERNKEKIPTPEMCNIREINNRENISDSQISCRDEIMHLHSSDETQTLEYLDKDIQVIPFGNDNDLYCCSLQTASTHTCNEKKMCSPECVKQNDKHIFSRIAQTTGGNEVLQQSKPSTNDSVSKYHILKHPNVISNHEARNMTGNNNSVSTNYNKITNRQNYIKVPELDGISNGANDQFCIGKPSTKCGENTENQNPLLNYSTNLNSTRKENGFLNQYTSAQVHKTRPFNSTSTLITKDPLTTILHGSSQNADICQYKNFSIKSQPQSGSIVQSTPYIIKVITNPHHSYTSNLIHSIQPFESSTKENLPKPTTKTSKTISLYQLMQRGFIKSGKNVLSVHTAKEIIFASLDECGQIIGQNGKTYNSPFQWCSDIPKFCKYGQKLTKKICHKRIYYQGCTLSYFENAYQGLSDQAASQETEQSSIVPNSRADLEVMQRSISPQRVSPIPNRASKCGPIALNLLKMKLLLIGDNEVGPVRFETDNWDIIDRWE